MSKPFQINDIVVPQGTKKTDFLSIQDDSANTVKLVVGIVNGSEDGPVVCITGGIYGTQYPGIDACIRIHKELDPSKLKGTVVTVPVVEMTGFQNRMDVSPIDGLNPNGYYAGNYLYNQSGLFPGSLEGTISFRIAYTLFNDIIKKSDYHLDLRGADINESLITFSVMCETGLQEFDSKTRALAKIMGAPYYLVSPFEYHKGRLIGEACAAGIPSIILEAGRGLGSYEEEDVKSCMRGIYNLLKWLKMMEGNPEIQCKPKREEFKIHRIVAKHGGLLYLQCKCGDFVTQGQRLGVVYNLQGEILQELIAPIEGMIHYIFPWHLKRPGQFILGIRRVFEESSNI